MPFARALATTTPTFRRGSGPDCDGISTDQESRSRSRPGSIPIFLHCPIESKPEKGASRANPFHLQPGGPVLDRLGPAHPDSSSCRGSRSSHAPGLRCDHVSPSCEIPYERGMGSPDRDGPNQCPESMSPTQQLAACRTPSNKGECLIGIRLRVRPLDMVGVGDTIPAGFRRLRFRHHGTVAE